MKWIKLKKYIYKHPHLVDDAYKLSMQEAQRIIDDGEPLSFEEMIRKAMAKSSIPNHKWEESVPVLKRAIRKKEQNKIKLVMVSSVAAIVLFFTSTPIGRTWAKGAIDFIISIFDGGMIVENRNHSEYFDGKITFNDAPAELYKDVRVEETGQETVFNTFEEFYDETGLNPIIVNHNLYEVQNIVYYSDESGTIVSVVYMSEDYGEMVTHQHFNKDQGMFIGMEEGYFIKKVLPQQYEMYCSISPEDNWFNGSMVLEDTVYTIGFSADMDFESVLDHIDYYIPDNI